MSNEVLPYVEMCRREGMSLQRGMNFGVRGNHSVVLMSIRPGAPYEDRIEDSGTTLIYEGHDEPRRKGGPDPKTIDQPEHSEGGSPTQNGLFHRAAQDFKRQLRPAERVRVYEKIRSGIWSYNGVFQLVDSWKEPSRGRSVFKFKLHAIEVDEGPVPRLADADAVPRRIIPTNVKVEVWKRDRGRCVTCGATDELHFDHILPFSRGGTSELAENVQLLCARHNLEKRDKII
jgi:hypothetical protein